MALQNIKRNTQLYIPGILSGAGLLGCFYIMAALAMDERMPDVPGGEYISTFMWMGGVIIGILSVILILYINSFLMKQRKNEYGLYNVLGMEKRHITKVMFCESAVSAIASAVIGVAFGLLFYKLATLAICGLLHAEPVAGAYYIKLQTVLVPVLIFLAMDLLAFAANCISIRRLKPVELLAEKHTGEKEPGVKRVIFFIGIISLGAGYYIALTTKSPLEAIFLFFAAVILIIAGTYFLFVSGTTFVLKCLRKNKKYYYSKKHMPVVSGLLFRMKQNAVGLASIAVLATGVLMMISTTVSLYSGVQDTLEKNYPDQLYLSGYYNAGRELSGEISEAAGGQLPGEISEAGAGSLKGQKAGDIENWAQIPSDELNMVVKEAAGECNMEIAGSKTEKYLEVSYLLRDGSLLTKADAENGWNANELVSVIFLTKEIYDEFQSKKLVAFDRQEAFGLEKDEIALCRISSDMEGIFNMPDKLKIAGKEYRVKEKLPYFPVNSTAKALVNTFGIVVPDKEAMDAIYRDQKEKYGDYASEYTDRICVSFADEEAAKKSAPELNELIFKKLSKRYPGGIEASLDTKWETEADLLGMYGTFLFIGILLGFVCLFSTVLIIYYKQISEGYEDRGRFQIMEKIGMEPKEVKSTIRHQLVLQFFLPLATAAVHTAVVFPLLLQMLKVLMLTNTALFIICLVITFLVFSAIYVAVYLLTAKTYYKIVH